MRYIVPKNTTGVYAIKHLPSGKMYVGGSGYCVYNRFRHHFVMLRKGTHINKTLQELWNSGSPGDFEQILLEICDKDAVRDREHHWIREFSSVVINVDQSELARSRWTLEGRLDHAEKMSSIMIQRHADGIMRKE